ncbi:MAG: TIGR03560 family F420-dependent LLM class oxidoreductase [Chloroflexi bacterium]|nr:TIGR03560 family F420-dependent LLM class oxidoreductase [Chloroflexota bacterium]
MTQIGIMIEGQDGLNWQRWRRLLQTAEDCGYQCVFRSDHFSNASGPDKDSLEMWISLAYAASHTKTIEFGPLVAPVTFRHPTMNLRFAAAIDDLSGGRLVLGMGAGWNEYEHRQFGIPFHDFTTRYRMLEESLQLSRSLLRSDEPVNYDGEFYQLNDAILLPRPARQNGPPILIGGNGPKRTLPLAAKYADEWNAVYVNLAKYKELRALMEQYLGEQNRPADDMKYSLMTRVVYRPTQARLDAFLHDSGISDEARHGGAMIVGTANEVIDQIAARVEAGVQRIMLQWMEMEDLENLELLARDILPRFAPESVKHRGKSRTQKSRRRSGRQTAQRARKAPKMPRAPKVRRKR